MKLKMLLALGSVLLSGVSLANDDWDYKCETKYKYINYYSGWASCEYTAENMRWTLSNYFSQSTTQYQYIYGTHYYADGTSSTVSCLAAVPFSHTEKVPYQVCKYVPREPYVNESSFEFTGCNRDKNTTIFFNWENIAGVDEYQAEKKVGDSWQPLYTGSKHYTNYTTIGDGKNVEYRVRAKDGNKIGSYWYTNFTTPNCLKPGPKPQPF